ncbi:MAG: hypothetical protein IJ509_04230 [Bacilli bacterium]|nr:hypothetical protein [Bacilli bacterium]
METKNTNLDCRKSLYDDYMSMLLLRQYVIFYGKLPDYSNCDMFGIDRYEIAKVRFIFDLLNKYDCFKGCEETNNNFSVEQWLMWKDEIEKDKEELYNHLETMSLPNGYIDDVTIHISSLLRKQTETKIRRDIKIFSNLTDEDIIDLEKSKYINNYFKLLITIFYLRDNDNIDNICYFFSKEKNFYFDNGSLIDKIINKIFNNNTKETDFKYNREDIEEIDEFYTEKLGLIPNIYCKESEYDFIERLNYLEKSAENLVYLQPSEFTGVILETKELINGTPEKNEYKRLVKR